MSISLKNHKILWAKSGNRCPYAGCKNELIVDPSLADDSSVIGEEAHIVARKEDGPRGKNQLELSKRDEYSNLILLCRNHHKEIDDQESKYSVSFLHEMKSNHEEWVKTNLDFSLNDFNEELKYSKYLDKIIHDADFDNWENWSSYLLSSGQPSISKDRYDSLKAIPNYVVSRFWPGKYLELERSIINFKNVLNDLTLVFDRYKQEKDDEYWTEKFYKIRDFDQERYHLLLDKYNYHVDLVEDLTLELTRAGNLLCERIRDSIHPNFREEEGKLLVTTGPDMSLKWQTLLIQYKNGEKTNRPYPGLESFLEERKNRDFNFGEGKFEGYLI